MNKSETHQRALIRLMLEKGEITACQIAISNANQYFKELERKGISEFRVGKLGNATVRWRYIPTNKREKALKYIGIVSTDNVQRAH